MAAIEAEVTFTLKLECFTRNRIFQRRFSKALFDHQRFRVNHRQEIIRSTWVRHAEQTVIQTDFNRQRMCRAHPVNNTFDFTTICRIDLEAYDILLLGIPTWYYGEAQCDWDDFFPTLEEIDFNGKLVALFGCGDQEDYAEYFCDALGTIRDIIEPRGATIVGHWPTAGYHFEASKGLADDDHFVGLAIDEDRQPELTAERVEKWVKQISEELHLDEILNA